MAQQSPSAAPVVEVIARHTEAGFYAPRFQQVFSSAVTDNYHAAAVTASGALIRVWTTPTNRLLVERTVINADGSPQVPFGTNWVQLSAAVSHTRGCAIATSGTEVLVWATNTAGTGILEFRSTNDGVSYAAPVTRFTEASAVTWMAAVSKSDGRTALVWNTGSTGGGTGATLRGARRSAAAAWSSAVSSALAAADIFGVAVLAGTDFGVVVAGRTTGALAPRLWGIDLTDATPPVWRTALELEKAEGGLVDRFEFHAPSLLNADRPRLTYIRAFFGQVARTNDIALTSQAHPGYAVTQRKWHEPISVDTATHGLALAGPGGGSYLWLTSPSRIHRAPAATPSHDLSGDVLALRASWTADGSALDLTLANPSGEYNTLADGSESAAAALTAGSEIEVKLGYTTPSGQQTATALPLYRVDSIERRYENGQHVVRVHGRDGLAQLERWRNPSQIVVAANTDDLAEVLERVTSRAGYAIYGNPVLLQARKPALTIIPGETGRTIAHNMVGKVAQALFDRAGKLTLRDVPKAAPAAYAFGPSYMQEVLAEPTLKAYWRFGDVAGSTSAVDHGPNANTATPNGGVILGAEGLLTADPDTAASFDGVNDYFSVVHSASLSLSGGIAVEAWIKYTGAPSVGSFWAIVEKRGTTKVNYGLNVDSGGKVYFHVWDGAANPFTISNAALNNGQRHHVVAVRDVAQDRLYMYVDGVLQTSQPADTTTAAITNSDPVWIGRVAASYFPGTIDELAIYETLPADRVAAHYEAGTGALTAERHGIAALRHGASLPEANEVAVFGAGRSDVARDTARQWRAGPALDIVYDRTNATNAQVTEHAAAALRLRTIVAASGRLTPALPNVGQELYDIVTITHAGTGLVNARKRVIGVHVDYRRGDGDGRFEQHLDLGEP